MNTQETLIKYLVGRSIPAAVIATGDQVRAARQALEATDATD